MAEVSSPPTVQPFREFTARLARGEETAFEEFHGRYFDRLHHLLLVICRGQEDEAREALQQTLLRVARYARPFESEEVFWSWLTALARSSARDGGRKMQRYRGMLERFRRFWARPPVMEAPSSETALEGLVEEALSQLPEPDRSLLAGKYLVGKTVRELAGESGLTEKAVEARLVRARRELRGVLHAILKP